MAGEDGIPTTSSLVIGLDGWGDTDDVVQAGTEQEAIVQDGIIYASYFLLTVTAPGEGSLVISDLTANPGDDIFCMVWMGDVNSNFNPNGGYAWFDIIDLTTSEYAFISTPLYGTFSGISAEWTMQRNTPAGSSSISDLADYWYAVMSFTSTPALHRQSSTVVSMLSLSRRLSRV